MRFKQFVPHLLVALVLLAGWMAFAKAQPKMSDGIHAEYRASNDDQLGARAGGTFRKSGPVARR